MTEIYSKHTRRVIGRNASLICAGALGLVGTSASANSSAAPSDPLNVVLQCRPIAEAAVQLACYNAAANKLADLVSRRQVKLIDQDMIKETKRSLFGFTLPRVPLFAGDTSLQIEEVDATIARVRQIDQTQIEIGMEDGALWKTVEAPDWGPPKVGSKVHIKRALMGSYFLTFKGQRPIRGIRTG